MIINYELIRSNRKSIGVTVDREGSVVVNVPMELGIDEVEKNLYKKRLWIWEKLALKNASLENVVQKKFISGESFNYLGKGYRLQIIDDNSSLKLRNGWFILGKTKQDKAKEIFKTWYVQHLKKKIDERLAIICKNTNIQKPDFKIMDLGFRWGSCTKEGLLNFNWKIAMAPLSVIDYIIVHEITHLKIHTHNEKFWKEIYKSMPNYLEKKEWLRENGYLLDL